MTQIDFFPPALPTAAPIAASSNLIKAVYVGEQLPATTTQEPDQSVAYWFSRVTPQPWYDPDKEHLIALLLNTKLKCFAWNLISIGSLNESQAHPREIIRPAIAAAAYGFILMHNHPSGDTCPSDADRRLTNRLKEGCDLLQIRLIDHVIVGRRATHNRFSFQEAGMIR